MLNLIMNFFRRQPDADANQLKRLVNMRAASTAVPAVRVAAGSDALAAELAVGRGQDSEKYGRKFWSTSGETYKPATEREAPEAVTECVMLAVKKRENVVADPLAQAESDWDAWNTGEHAAYSDDRWIQNYSKTLEEIEAYRAELDVAPKAVGAVTVDPIAEQD